MIIRSAIVEKLHFTLKTLSPTTSITPTDVISRSRETLADTVAPYRWSDNQLEEFLDDGVTDLRTFRSDVTELANIPEAFASALANYVVSRAFALDNDAQNNNGQLSDKYLALFMSQAAAVPFYFTDEQLGQYADETVLDLVSKRPELRIDADGALKEKIRTVNEDSIEYDLPERFTDGIVFGAAGRAAVHAKNDAASYFFEQYNGAVKTI